MQNRCIYCDNENGLSESDIIPDTMTNVRILNKNVCEEFHNKPFSDFENEVFKDFSFILNKLDIRSHKKKFDDSYPSYETDCMLNGQYYHTNISSCNDFKTRKVLLKRDDDEKIILNKGTAKRIVKQRDTGKTIVEDIQNPLNIDHSKTYISQQIFFSTNICRLMSKIAFEWYCRENNISGKKDEFTNIIDYITTGKGIASVTIIHAISPYEFIAQELSDRPGSHRLLCIIDNNRINVYISFLDLIIYHVIVAESIPINCKNNFLYRVINTDGTTYSESFPSQEVFANRCNSIMNDTILSFNSNIENLQMVEFGNNESTMNPEFSVCIANEQQKALFEKGLKYSYLFRYAEILLNVSISDELEISSSTRLSEDLFDWITNRIKYTLQVGTIHLRELKHFVNEHSLHNKEKINLETASPSELFNYFYLLKIGEIKTEKIDNKIIVEISKDLPRYTTGNKQILLTDEYASRLKELIVKTQNYKELIYRGAELIRR